MRRFLYFVLIALMAVACYDDSELREAVNRHEERLNELWALCQTLNDDIASLQIIVEAMQGGDYITGLSPIVEGDVEVGYEISFKKGGKITIYHGEKGEKGDAGADGKDGADGAPGADGKDGATPVIGVAMDEADGVYYWTLDGEWLLDDDGNKVKAVGTDGKDCQEGKDGVTPKLKIEEGYWCVSYDEGLTWTRLDKAVSESEPSEPLSLFADVYQQDGNVYFVLSDGQIYMVPMAPEDGVKSYYTDEISKTIASVNNLITEPCLVFPMITDIHYKSSKECPDLIDITMENMVALSKDIRFDFFACLGDITDGKLSQDETEQLVRHLYDQFMRVDAPFYPCIGNHDDNRYKTAFSHAQLHRIYMRNTLDVMFDKTSMCGTNYYKDFYGLGVRCIFLNANDSGAYGFADETCDWFEQAVKTEYDIYVFSHISPVQAHQYNQVAHKNDERIVAAIKGAPTFKMLFNGHSHFDSEFTAPFNDTTNPFLAYSLCCNKFQNGGPDDLWPSQAVRPTREVGTVTEDCFDIVVIRPFSGKVNTVRFGAGYDKEFDVVSGMSVGESAQVNFPDEMTVTLDFTAGWPFFEECAESLSQSSAGEYYRYIYECENGEFQMNFGIQRSLATDSDEIYYSYTDGGLVFGNADGPGTTNGIINVPGVAGHYVTSIEITHATKARFTIADGTQFVYNASPNNTTSSTVGPTLINLPVVDDAGETLVPAVLGNPYNIRIRNSSLKVTKIVVNYSTTKPE